MIYFLIKIFASDFFPKPKKSQAQVQVSREA